MNEIKINGKAIYTTKGAAREYGRVGCNFYTGCPHECEYCYLKRGITGKALGGTEVRLKKCFKDEEDARQVFIREMYRYHEYLRQTGIFFSFTTDPMIPETRELTRFAASFANMHGVPVKILTKDASWIDIYGRTMQTFLASTFFPENISFGFTLTGRDDMEPKASTNLERIQNMRSLHNIGFKTWASIEPVIDWTHANMVVEMSLDCCDHYKIGLRSGVKKDYYNLVRSGMWMDDLTKKITAAGRTVYLKESARKLLQRCYIEDYYNEILSRTVDMDGNNITRNQKGGVSDGNNMAT